MNAGIAILATLAALALAAAIMLRTGLARWLFFRLYAHVKGEELVGPTLLHNLPTDSPYQRWLERCGPELPVREGLCMHDVEGATLRPWPQLGDGVTGLYLRFAEYQLIDARLVELPRRGGTVEQRHLYEKGIYVLRGQGCTRLQQENQPERDVSWKTGDLFSIPLNVRHRHRNTGDGPARLLIVTTFPLMLNLFDDEDFVVNNPGVFRRRYDGEPGFLDAAGELARLELTANFVEDIRTTPARQNDFRGRGNRSIRWQMAGNSGLSMHISEMPPRMVKKSHRITSNAFVLVLSGSGFTVLWREGLYRERVRIDWKPGTLFAPPVFWYQQHLNPNAEPARYLAINVPGLIRNLGLHFEDQLEVHLPEVVAEWKKELQKKPNADGTS